MSDAWDQLMVAEPDLAGQLLSRVERGARLLDQVEPGWYRRIAADRLAMESCDRCVLGQLHGDFLEGFRMILRSLPNRNRYSAADHGFTLYSPEQRIEYQPDPADPTGMVVANESAIMLRFAALADLWRRHVLAREAS
jgi:hypothetical protein